MTRKLRSTFHRHSRGSQSSAGAKFVDDFARAEEFVLGKEGWTMTWAVPPVARDQLVLFPSSLDDVIPEEHLVRDLDAILRSLDWSEFEAKSHGTLGARPVHPRVLASIIIYGHLTRVRSSRQLEGALWCRLDFR